MPDKFPLEHFYKTYHPDAWYEFWQDSDFDYPDQIPATESMQDEESENWSCFGWAEPHYFEP